MYAWLFDQEKIYVIAFQVHWLGTDPSERLGQRSREVPPIQECALDQWETAGYWGERI